MRKAGLGLALLASAQLSLLSSPAFADDSSTKASLTPTESASTSASSSTTTSSSPDAQKKKGWIILGVGGGVTLAGIVLNIVGTQVGHVAGTGGPGDSGTTSNAKTNFYWGGTALMVAGIVTGIVGGSMVLNNGDGKSTPADHTQDAERTDGVTKTVQAAYQSAPAVTLPIVGATF